MDTKISEDIGNLDSQDNEIDYYLAQAMLNTHLNVLTKNWPSSSIADCVQIPSAISGTWNFLGLKIYFRKKSRG